MKRNISSSERNARTAIPRSSSKTSGRTSRSYNQDLEDRVNQSIADYIQAGDDGQDAMSTDFEAKLSLSQGKETHGSSEMSGKNSGLTSKSTATYEDELEYRVDRDIANFCQINENLSQTVEETVSKNEEAAVSDDAEIQKSGIQQLGSRNQWKRGGIRFGAGIDSSLGMQEALGRSVAEKAFEEENEDDTFENPFPNAQTIGRQKALKRSTPDDDESSEAKEAGPSSRKKNARRSEGEIMYRNGKLFKKWEKRYMFVDNQRDIGRVLIILRLEDGIVSAQNPERIPLRGCTAQPLMSLRGQENEFRFIVHAGKTSHEFCCSSAEERQYWLGKFDTHAAANE